jgi:hypothetical protein
VLYCLGSCRTVGNVSGHIRTKTEHSPALFVPLNIRGLARTRAYSAFICVATSAKTKGRLTNSARPCPQTLLGSFAALASFLGSSGKCLERPAAVLCPETHPSKRDVSAAAVTKLTCGSLAGGASDPPVGTTLIGLR